MYNRDMPKIKAYGLADPDHLVNVITMVLLTIQQPFHQIAGQYQNVCKTGNASKYLFGSKRAGHAYAVKHKDAIFAAVQSGDIVEVIDHLTNIPGLGIVKASFVAQLIGFEVACLDVHNLRRLGLPVDALRLAKTVKPATKLRKIREYIALCAKTGGSEFWWNTWCDHVAGKRGSKLLTGDAVSAFHPAILGI